MQAQNILIFGGSGFIGKHLSTYLDDQGHRLTLVSRRPPASSEHKIQIAQNVLRLTNDQLHDLLDDQDIVINCVGVLRAGRQEQLYALHADWPQRLYAACQTARKPLRVIHFSALGSGESSSHYHRSKAAGEAALIGSGLDYYILRPSLIYGHAGNSTRLYRKLARMALTPVLWQGRQQVQPIRIEDVCEAVGQLMVGAHAPRLIRLVGPRPVRMHAYMALLRGPDHTALKMLNLPNPLTQWLARLGDVLPFSPLCSDTWKMLQQHNTADPSATAHLLGRMPVAAEAFTQDKTWNT